MLRSKSGGEKVRQEYQATETLTEARRGKMVNILVAHMIDNLGHVFFVIFYLCQIKTLHTFGLLIQCLLSVTSPLKKSEKSLYSTTPQFSRRWERPLSAVRSLLMITEVLTSSSPSQDCWIQQEFGMRTLKLNFESISSHSSLISSSLKVDLFCLF